MEMQTHRPQCNTTQVNNTEWPQSGFEGLRSFPYNSNHGDQGIGPRISPINQQNALFQDLSQQISVSRESPSSSRGSLFDMQQSVDGNSRAVSNPLLRENLQKNPSMHTNSLQQRQSQNNPHPSLESRGITLPTGGNFEQMASHPPFPRPQLPHMPQYQGQFLYGPVDRNSTSQTHSRHFSFENRHSMRIPTPPLDIRQNIRMYLQSGDNRPYFRMPDPNIFRPSINSSLPFSDNMYRARLRMQVPSMRNPPISSCEQFQVFPPYVHNSENVTGNSRVRHSSGSSASVQPNTPVGHLLGGMTTADNLSLVERMVGDSVTLNSNTTTPNSNSLHGNRHPTNEMAQTGISENNISWRFQMNQGMVPPELHQSFRNITDNNVHHNNKSNMSRIDVNMNTINTCTSQDIPDDRSILGKWYKLPMDKESEKCSSTESYLGENSENMSNKKSIQKPEKQFRKTLDNIVEQIMGSHEVVRTAISPVHNVFHDSTEVCREGDQIGTENEFPVEYHYVEENFDAEISENVGKEISNNELVPEQNVKKGGIVQKRKGCKRKIGLQKLFSPVKIRMPFNSTKKTGSQKRKPGRPLSLSSKFDFSEDSSAKNSVNLVENFEKIPKKTQVVRPIICQSKEVQDVRNGSDVVENNTSGRKDTSNCMEDSSPSNKSSGKSPNSEKISEFIDDTIIVEEAPSVEQTSPAIVSQIVKATLESETPASCEIPATSVGSSNETPATVVCQASTGNETSLVQTTSTVGTTPSADVELGIVQMPATSNGNGEILPNDKTIAEYDTSGITENEKQTVVRSDSPFDVIVTVIETPARNDASVLSQVSITEDSCISTWTPSSSSNCQITSYTSSTVNISPIVQTRDTPVLCKTPEVQNVTSEETDTRTGAKRTSNTDEINNAAINSIEDGKTLPIRKNLKSSDKNTSFDQKKIEIVNKIKASNLNKKKSAILLETPPKRRRKQLFNVRELFLSDNENEEEKSSNRKASSKTDKSVKTNKSHKISKLGSAVDDEANELVDEVSEQGMVTRCPSSNTNVYDFDETDRDSDDQFVKFRNGVGLKVNSPENETVSHLKDRTNDMSSVLNLGKGVIEESESRTDKLGRKRHRSAVENLRLKRLRKKSGLYDFDESSDSDYCQTKKSLANRRVIELKQKADKAKRKVESSSEVDSDSNIETSDSTAGLSTECTSLNSSIDAESSVNEKENQSDVCTSADDSQEMMAILSCRHDTFKIEFHGKILMAISINSGKFVVMKELLHKCFSQFDDSKKTKYDKGNRLRKFKHVYVAKERDLKIPYRELPGNKRRKLESYLISENIGMKNGHMHIGIVSLSDALRLYHYFFGVKSCVKCVVMFQNEQNGIEESEKLWSYEGRMLSTEESILKRSDKMVEEVKLRAPQNCRKRYQSGQDKYVKKKTVPEQQQRIEDISVDNERTVIRVDLQSELEPRPVQTLNDEVESDSDETIPYIDSENEGDHVKSAVKSNNSSSRSESRDIHNDDCSVGLPADIGDIILKGGIAELYDRMFRFIVINNVKFFPLKDVGIHFNKFQVMDIIYSTYLKTSTCSEVQANFFTRLEPSLPKIEKTDLIIEEKILHETVRLDSEISSQSDFEGTLSASETEKNEDELSTFEANFDGSLAVKDVEHDENMFEVCMENGHCDENSIDLLCHETELDVKVKGHHNSNMNSDILEDRTALVLGSPLNAGCNSVFSSVGGSGDFLKEVFENKKANRLFKDDEEADIISVLNDIVAGTEGGMSPEKLEQLDKMEQISSQDVREMFCICQKTFNDNQKAITRAFLAMMKQNIVLKKKITDMKKELEDFNLRYEMLETTRKKYEEMVEHLTIMRVDCLRNHRTMESV